MSKHKSGAQGFTIIEVMICTLVLTTGMLAIAALLGVSVQAQVGAREAARSMRLAEEKIDELMKLDFDATNAASAGGSLDANQTNHYETPVDGITLRWTVAAHPASTEMRTVTVRVVNMRAAQYRNLELSTIIREW